MSLMWNASEITFFFLLLAGSEFEQDALTAHNKYRAIHAAQPMKLNSEMSANAEKWAQNLVAKGKLEHSTREQRNGNGENLYYSCGLPVSGSSSTKEWWEFKYC